MTYKQLEKFLGTRLVGIKTGSTPNQYSALPIYLEATIENESRFNEIYYAVRSCDLSYLIRTANGSIRKGPRYMSNLYAWDIRTSSIGIQLTIVINGRIYAVKYGNYKGSKSPDIFPNVAFSIFTEKCEEHGINLYDYSITNGLKVKEEIERPLINMYQLHKETDKGIDNVHHIDFHNSYPAGLANTHPEFRPVVEYFYEKRKESPVNKAVLNYTIGWMQSWAPDKGRLASWAHLSRDAIKNNNERIEELTMRLILSGREIIGHNTDGIWYRGEIYHGEGEGKGLGEWENDHVNCLFRAKSSGAYEFIENGVYHPVLRGTSTLDSIQPDRSKWTWGDIYRQAVVCYKFDIEKGIYRETV